MYYGSLKGCFSRTLGTLKSWPAPECRAVVMFILVEFSNPLARLLQNAYFLAEHKALQVGKSSKQREKGNFQSPTSNLPKGTTNSCSSSQLHTTLFSFPRHCYRKRRGISDEKLSMHLRSVFLRTYISSTFLLTVVKKISHDIFIKTAFYETKLRKLNKASSPTGSHLVSFSLQVSTGV